jgi:hypothetical protein
MENDKASCPLMDLPLEVRHAIFEFTAVRNVKPKRLLRHWFEKKEAKELIAQKIADDPSAPAPCAVYHNEYDEESDVSEQEDDTDSASEDEGDEDGEDNQNEVENEDDSEDDAEAEDDDMLQNQDEDEVDDMEDEDDEAADGVGLIQAHNTTQLTASGQAQSLLIPAVQAQNQSASTNQQADDDEMGDDDDEDSDDDAQDDGDATGTVAAPPPPPAPAVHVSHKWRHVPNFMRITHCPPPVELLLVSKQLNQEAKDWFYDVAVLRINATGSFAHTSFFEEALRQITEAAFSPMENVRKVEATFAWDTTWLRADETGYAGAVFPALLRQRSDFVYQASSTLQSISRQMLTSCRSSHRLLTSRT